MVCYNYVSVDWYFNTHISNWCIYIYIVLYSAYVYSIYILHICIPPSTLFCQSNIKGDDLQAMDFRSNLLKLTAWGRWFWSSEIISDLYSRLVETRLFVGSAGETCSRTCFCGSSNAQRTKLTCSLRIRSLLSKLPRFKPFGWLAARCSKVRISPAKHRNPSEEFQE